MKNSIDTQINDIGGKIDTKFTLVKALISSSMGTEELTERDAGNIIYLLEEKIKDLKSNHDNLIDELKIWN